jgi:hypothetical protein
MVDMGDGKLTRVMVVENRGHDGYVVRWTQSCSGCHETNEGYETGLYPYDEKAQCYVGAGCSECGYTGKRRMEWWIPFDPRAEKDIERQIDEEIRWQEERESA